MEKPEDPCLWFGAVVESVVPRQMQDGGREIQ